MTKNLRNIGETIRQMAHIHNKQMQHGWSSPAAFVDHDPSA